MKTTMRTANWAIAIVTFSCILFYACQKDVSASKKPTATKIYLTDHQTPVFDSIFIDIQRLEIKVEDDSISNEGWVELPIRTGIYNILKLRNGIDTLFASGILPGTNIRKIRLTLGTRNSAMKNSQVFPLELKNEDRQVVAELNSSNFEFGPNGEILFWIDFDASRSIQEDNSGSGNGNGYRLRSHISVFSRQHSGRIEGRVLPLQADALVMAINGTDTTMSVPDDGNGEFRIVGLRAGTYRLFYNGQNGYMDTTINNVIVINGEDTHVSNVTLHQ
jgi:hypothetical protein